VRALLSCAALSLACAGTEPGSARACEAQADPAARAGRLVEDALEPFAPGDFMEVVESPQGGFGSVFHIEAQGIAPDGDHLVDVEIEARLDDTIVGRYRIRDAPLDCREPGPGRWGAVLLTLDQERFVQPQDLELLEGEDVVLALELTDDEGESARGEHVVQVGFMP
jgi:hypothetical protein